MKKKLMSVLSLLSLLVLMTACQNPSQEEATTTVAETEAVTTAKESSTSEKKDTMEVSIEILVDGQAIKPEETFEVESGSKLLTVMKDHYEIEEKDGFVQAIEGHQQDEAANKWWLFDVNGEMAEVGAADLTLNPGDQISWKLAVLE